MNEKYFQTIKGPRKQNFIKTALKMGVKIKILSEEFRVLKFEHRNKAKLIYNEDFYFNKKPSTFFTKNKEITKTLLRESQISVPRGIFAKDLREALERMAQKSIDFPVVAKPIDAMKGFGVTVGIENETQLWQAIEKIKKFWREHNQNNKHDEIFMIEEMVQGKDFRVLVLNKKVIACVERVPAHIIGNGRSIIKEIIRKFNQNRPSKFQLKIDNEVRKTLKFNGLKLDSVLPRGLKLWLRKNANISSGGIALDKTERVSNYFKKIAIKSVASLGLNYGGVDIMTSDITSENSNQGYYLIEINGAPDYDIHEKPIVRGKEVGVTKILIKHLMNSD